MLKPQKVPKSSALVHGVGLNDSVEPVTQYDSRTGVYVSTRPYETWTGILKHSYAEPSGWSVCPEWHRYSIFKEWFDQNYVAGYQINKGLAHPGNTVYSPETCRFVPDYLSNLVNDHEAKRGRFQLGVGYIPQAGKFSSVCSFDGKQRNLGYFQDSASAHRAWQLAKAAVVVESVMRYSQGSLVHEDVVHSLLDYADRLRSDAKAGRETFGFNLTQQPPD